MEIGEAKMGDPVHQTLVLGRSMDPCMLKTPPVAAHLQTPAGASIALKSGIRRCRGTVPFAWRSSSAVFPARRLGTAGRLGRQQVCWNLEQADRELETRFQRRVSCGDAADKRQN
jgi:hypothetical protein